MLQMFLNLNVFKPKCSARWVEAASPLGGVELGHTSEWKGDTESNPCTGELIMKFEINGNRSRLSVEALAREQRTS